MQRQNLRKKDNQKDYFSTRDSVKDVTDPKQLAQADFLFSKYFTHHFHSKAKTVSEILLQLARQKIKVLIHNLIQSGRLIVCELFFKSMITM